MIPKNFFNPDNAGTLRLLEEKEWRGIGITQSLGWEHYEVHGEPSLFPPPLDGILTSHCLSAGATRASLSTTEEF